MECGIPNTPAVYTNVAEIESWMRNFIKDNNYGDQPQYIETEEFSNVKTNKWMKKDPNYDYDLKYKPSNRR